MTAAEYLELARECLSWATDAETDDQRTSYLEMARTWTLAAMRLEGVSASSQAEPMPVEQQTA